MDTETPEARAVREGGRKELYVESVGWWKAHVLPVLMAVVSVSTGLAMAVGTVLACFFHRRQRAEIKKATKERIEFLENRARMGKWNFKKKKKARRVS